MVVDVIATKRHYAAHLAPIWSALPDDCRGVVYATREAAELLPGRHGTLRDAGRDKSRLTLVAGHVDLARLRHRTGVMVEHGCGQSYGGRPSERVAARHPAYPGGRDRDRAVLFLHPNEYGARRDRAAYPNSRVEVIGSPRLVDLMTVPHEPTDPPTVAVTVHWDATVCLESGNAWRAHRSGFEQLAKSGKYRVIGHGHPRIFRSLVPHYRRMGIEPVPEFTEVLRRASLLIADNTSALFEFAAVRGPVVVLDAPWWRTNVEHGLRFWDCADVGPRIVDPAGLETAVEAALDTVPWPGADEILDRVFPPVENPAAVAAHAITATAELLDR